MARLGAHSFLWEIEWTPPAAERMLQAAKAADLDLIEVALLHPDGVDGKHTRQVSRDLGVGVTCSLGLPREATLPDHPREAEAFLKHALDVSAAMGSPCLTGVVYGSIGKVSGAPPTEEEYAVIERVLKPVARHAAGLGLVLGIEACNRYETHLVNTGAQAAELMARIGEPNLFVHLDTYHMNIEEKGMAAPIEALGSKLGYLHLSESDRGVPGTGNVDWDATFRGIAASGYDGPLVLESFLVAHPDIARGLSLWRPVAPSVDAVMGEGLAFLRERARAHGVVGI
jgi:D-psicose/D-tagatose/L-ribulose 3-epimerase